MAAVKNREDRFKAYFGGKTNRIADCSDVRDEGKKSQRGIPGFVLRMVVAFPEMGDSEKHAGEAGGART